VVPAPPAPGPVDPRVHRVGLEPELYVVDDFLTPAEVFRVIEVASDRDALEARGVAWKHDETGFSFEMPIDGDPVLERIRARIQAASGLVDGLGTTFRFRHYGEREAHGLHLDAYRIGARDLAVTALVHLADTERGGATRFPKARPAPVEVAPRAGRLVLWWNVRADGTPDPASLHEGLPVVAGVKMTITEFVYVDRAQLERAWTYGRSVAGVSPAGGSGGQAPPSASASSRSSTLG
jgi:prolyl 4-hydroxylase